MSGHNKWSQIKRQKEKTDAQKSRAFSKYGKLIAAEAKKAKGNRESPGLKAMIERAKAENMPNDNIERAIKKATDNSAVLEGITYEAYGPGGCALIIEALTENRNKAAQEIKFILGKHGFTLAGQGSALWAFKKHDTNALMGANDTNNYGKWKPTITIPLEETDLKRLQQLVEELEENDEVQEVFINAE
ncbi:MAG: YebC/PmpR family DNA-binding transcriptional regulator [Candidatus Taylorbacteria bacterium]|nr:YebC/PmpR family DNA-binding transcriptional regulator [Candidatus Taylorbacteria bacterium]